MAGLEVYERLGALEEASDTKDARMDAFEERIEKLEKILRENKIEGLAEEAKPWSPRQDHGWRNHGEKQS